MSSCQDGTPFGARKIKWLPLCLLAILFCLFFYFHLQQYLNLHTLSQYQADLQQWTNTHYKSAVSLYVLIYTILIATTIPCATIFTLIGGFLFGSIALLYAVFSITFGGLILYFAVRTALGERIANTSSHWLKKLETGFQQNAFYYLLMLRLVPIFPCWLSNIAAGMLSVPLSIFIIATVLGILPSTFLYVMVGRGLDQFILSKPLSLSVIFANQNIFWPCLALAIFSLFPVIYRYLKKTSLFIK